MRGPLDVGSYTGLKPVREAVDVVRGKQFRSCPEGPGGCQVSVQPCLMHRVGSRGVKKADEFIQGSPRSGPVRPWLWCMRPFAGAHRVDP